MWPFDDLLEPWFEDVDRKRKEKYGSPSDASSEGTFEVENELARDRR
jgi:hypothetical protein